MASEKFKFQKLTPVHDAKLSIYKDALDFVFENPDIKNVAISGAYSAGKSSVVETYEQTKAGTKFLHISLAYFDSADSSDGKAQQTPEKDVIKENVLEGKILNQLIHQIDAKKIPQTNFRVKQTVSKERTAFQALSGLLLTASALFTLNFHSWETYIEKHPFLQSWLTWTIAPVVPLISCGIVAILLTWFLYVIIQTQKNKNLFKRVSLQGNEIEIFAQSDDSYFDKYLNEVLYLFEKSGADVIVFEDMDRYNANHIFQRLREVNTLISNRRKWEDKKPIRFFYLLRDDIFVSKDRTKFFDFIIPIVPILDGSNSYDQFIEHFKLGGIFNLFNENFLQGISLYVDDMRILKNVYNEFVIYNTRIGTTEQNANKLLALIVYKNLFPRDFSDLQLNKGFVFSLFSSKDKFIAKKQTGLRQKKSDLTAEIQKMKSDALLSAIEIDTFYSNYHPYHNYYGLISKYESERDERKKLVLQREQGGIEKLQAEIEKCNQKITILNNQKLSEIIDRENIDSIFKNSAINEIEEVNEFKEIKGSDYFDLLKYLIREGFIDETYPDYMTYFYENSLSRIDKVFLRSVTDQRAKGYTYLLQKPDMIVKRLRIVDFEREETLNFDLLCHLLQERFCYSEQLSRLIQQLRTAKLYDFIIQFIESGREMSSFIRVINHQWPQFFGEILEESSYSDAHRKRVALLSLYFSPDKDILKINSENVLSNFISHSSDFLQIQEPQIEILISKFELLQIQFVYIDFAISNNGLWKEVYSRNLYELNWAMIECVLENQYQISKSDNYLHKNLTLVLSQEQEPLGTYIKANIDKYFELMLAHCDNQIIDTEDIAIYTLNNESVSDENKQKYIDALSTKISSLDAIKGPKWWTKLMANELLLYSENNVLCYFFGTGNKYDNALVQFINGQFTSPSFEIDIIIERFGENGVSIFFDATAKCNALKNDKYKAILSVLHRYYTPFLEENIDGDKVEILIDLQIIHMTLPDLIFMREHYPDQVLAFIVKNQKTYVESTIDENSFLMSEALDVLRSGVESTYKIDLLKFTDEAISVQKVDYVVEVESYILLHNFSKDDLPYILERYDKLNPSSQNAVDHLAKIYIHEISINEFQIAFSLLQKLLADKSLDISIRLELFSFSVDNLDRTQCKNGLKELSAHNYLYLFDGKRPKFEISDVNERILNAFQRKGWITRFEEKEGFYRAIGRKLKIKHKLPTELL